MNKETIGIIGIGHLGHAIEHGLSNAGYQTLLNNGDQKRTVEKLKAANIMETKAATLQDIAENCSMLLLCIKHSQLAEVGMTLNHLLNEHHTVISFLAQASLIEVESVITYSDCVVAKAMTTLGVANNQGVSAYQLLEGRNTKRHHKMSDLLESISAKDCVFEFQTEELMQLFTVAVGCFPGLMAHFLDQLHWSVLQQRPDGFNDYGKAFSVLLRSTADLLDKEGSARELRNKVSTKGGVTQTLIQSLGESGLTQIMSRAVSAGMNKMSGSTETKKV